MNRYIIILILITIANISFAKSNQKPLVVFVCGDHEYSGEVTLPLIAKELEKNYGFRTKVISSFPDQNAETNLPGLEILKEADLVVFFLRWRLLPPDQLALIDEYLKSGKPVMGFRTSTHAFNFQKGHPSEKWNAFGEFALNAPPGWGKAGHTHYGHKSTTDIYGIETAKKHPIMKGINPNFHVPSWLYHVLPSYPTKGSQWLLMGKSVNPDNLAAIDNPVAWVGINSFGAKVFTTTLGHPEDFEEESFQHLIINAIHFQTGKKVPKKWKGKIEIHVPYRGMVKSQ